MKYAGWVKTVPEEITGDSLWKVEAYRLSLFAAEIGWCDVTRLAGDRRTLDLAGQLFRALGSIEANIGEGYSRGGGRDRARFYDYALGSARESRGWYYKGRHVLGEDVARHRITFLTHIIRLLLAMIPDQRNFGSFQEETAEYGENSESAALATIPNAEEVARLIETVPMA